MEARIAVAVLATTLIAILVGGVDGIHVHSSIRPHQSNGKSAAQQVTSRDQHNSDSYSSCVVTYYTNDDCAGAPLSSTTRTPFVCDPNTNTVFDASGSEWSWTLYQHENCTGFPSGYSGTVGECTVGTFVTCDASSPTPPPPTPPPSQPTGPNTLTLFNVMCQQQYWQSNFFSGQCLPGPGGDAPFQNWRVTVDNTTSVFTAEFFGDFDCSGEPLEVDQARGDVCMAGLLFINYQVQIPIASPCTVTTYVNGECTSAAPLNTYAATPNVCVPGTVYTVATNKLLIDPETLNWTIQYYNTTDTTCSEAIVGVEQGSADQCDQTQNRKVVCETVQPIQLA